MFSVVFILDGFPLISIMVADKSETGNHVNDVFYSFEFSKEKVQSKIKCVIIRRHSNTF